MKKIILMAFLGMFVFAGLSHGQYSGISGKVTGITVDPGDLDNFERVVITYAGLENQSPRFFEAVIPASTPGECLANRDFSNAVRLSPDRARATYDAATSTGTFRWVVEKATPNECRVLLVRSRVSADGLNFVRLNYESAASTGGTEQMGFTWTVTRPT